MEKQTILARQIESAGEKARLDAACKKLLAHKIILAWILKSTMEEFSAFEVNEIAECYIEGTPVVAGAALHQDETGSNGVCIQGEATEAGTITEGTVTFDIRFRAIAPVSGEDIQLIINVEAQNNFYPGYPLVKRGIYYCCRLVSGQYGTEFTNAEYNEIKKVYSIWICINPPKNREYSITKYQIEERNIVGNVKEAKSDYDLMSAVILCLGKERSRKADGAADLLTVLLSTELDAEEKKTVLEKEFGIEMYEELEQEVTQMCNYSKGVEERGIELGIEQGIKQGVEQGTFQTLCLLVKDGVLSVKEAAQRMDLKEEAFRERMKQQD